MRVIIASPYGEALASTVAKAGAEPLLYRKPPLDAQGDMLISYGWRRLISPAVLGRFPAGCFNLHISLLPWNRGADPNFWSFFDQTPKGVSIHELTEGLDEGDIVAHHPVRFSIDEATLATTYQRLRREVEALFDSAFPFENAGRVAQHNFGPGTAHRLGEAEPYLRRLSKGWNTPISEVEALGEQERQG